MAGLTSINIYFFKTLQHSK